jgi:MFS transporter, DHA3 family, tetracycline resistance protein
LPESRARSVFLFMELSLSFLFAIIFTTTSIYRIQSVGMTPFQLVLIGTALEASIFLLEVPTGVLADTYSRRLSILLGIAFLGLHYLATGLFTVFWAHLLIQILGGFGYAFISGAQQAWITDEIGQENAAKAMLRVAQFGNVAGILGILAGMFLGSINLVFPIVLGSTLMLALAGLLFFIMPENGFKPTPKEDRNTFQHMFGTFKDGLHIVRSSRFLILVVGITVVFGAFSESFDRLNEAHFLNTIGMPGNFSPVIWFGFLSLLAIPLNVVFGEFIRRRLDVNNSRAISRGLLAAEAGIVGCAFVFAFAGSFWLGAMAFIILGLLRGIRHPLQVAWINPHVESGTRATVFSMISQTDAIGQIAGGPALGAIADRSMRGALALGAALLLPNLLLYRRAENGLPLVDDKIKA